jgi:hypothetical protein
LPGRNANTNPNFDTGKSDANANSYGDIYAGKSDADGYSNSDDATSVAHAHGDCDGDNHAEAYAYAKAAAHAVPASDAVSEWAKRSKQLQSNRELARQLASSLLCGGSTSPENASPARTDGYRVAEGASYRRHAAIAFANALRTTRSTCAFSKLNKTSWKILTCRWAFD